MSTLKKEVRTVTSNQKSCEVWASLPEKGHIMFIIASPALQVIKEALFADMYMYSIRI